MSNLLKLVSVVVVIVFSTSVFAQNNTEEKILYNGKIFTARGDQSYVEAVGLKGDKIVALGTLLHVKSNASRRATMIDLQGKFLLPGLIDSHNHAISGGESLLAAHLNDELLDRNQLAEFAGKVLQSRKGMLGDVLFIQGVHSGTWAMVNDLDKLFNQEVYITQPVVLRGSDGHTAWANRVMLTRAGINSDFIRSLSEDEKKFFGFDESFTPNGLISEDGFGTIRKALPPDKTDVHQAAILGVNHLNSLGITAWMDPSAGSVSEGENNGELLIYKWLSQQKKLTAHVTAIVVADPNEENEHQIAVVKKLQQNFSDVENVSVLGFKIFADGVLEYPTQTAAVSIPYKNSGQYGSLMVKPDAFKKFVVRADREKLLVHVHSIGDRAVTEALNSFESARKANGNFSISHSITHLQLVKPADFKRFSELNVLVSMQLLWATADSYTMDLVKPYVDSTLFENQYPAMSLLKNGATICGASDWPVSSANPFEAIYVAETRIGKLGVLDAAEIMPRMEMIKAYTINAAKAILLEKSIGSIEVGKQADFVLVDRDVLTVSPEDIKGTKVVWTMFSGEIVYKK